MESFHEVVRTSYLLNSLCFVLYDLAVTSAMFRKLLKLIIHVSYIYSTRDLECGYSKEKIGFPLQLPNSKVEK